MKYLKRTTYLCTIDDSVDISYFFNMSEEEENHCDFDEIKSIPAIYSIPLVIDFEGFQKIKFSVLNDRKVNSITPKVFLQPPELI